MKRRSFLSMGAAASASLWLPRALGAEAAVSPDALKNRDCGNLLILIELKGGNDGLNTVIPFADPSYYALRKHIGIKREQAIQLDERTALHPASQALMPLWRDQQLAIVQGVGYAQPNQSHFRSTEIWDTASHSDQYLRDGWLTRAFAQMPAPAGFAATGVTIGSAEVGPLANSGRTSEFGRTPWFVETSQAVVPALAPVSLSERNLEVAHRLGSENAIANAAGSPRTAQARVHMKTVFPGGAFGHSIRSAMQMLATANTQQAKPVNGRGIVAIRLTMNGFDTHHNQPMQHAALLKQLAEGLMAMKSALVELGRWNETLVMTYAEFGRRPRENQNSGTDHGTVAPHFVTGGRVRGGLYGASPELARLDGDGNLPVGVDFRRLYATVLGDWWGLDASTILQQRFEPLPLLRT